MAGGAGSHIGRGGMLTKVLAAKRAARSGAHTVIASGHEPEVLPRLLRGESIGTLLIAPQIPLAARKQWLADHLNVSGRLGLDAGAVRALVRDGKEVTELKKGDGGAVVLPGLDVSLDARAWSMVGVTDDSAAGHPQALLRRLIELIGAKREDVTVLGAGDSRPHVSLVVPVFNAEAAPPRLRAVGGGNGTARGAGDAPAPGTAHPGGGWISGPMRGAGE